MGMGISPLPAHRMRWGEGKNPNHTPQRNKPKPKPKEDAPQCPGHNITIRAQAADWPLLRDRPSSAGQPPARQGQPRLCCSLLFGTCHLLSIWHQHKGPPCPTWQRHGLYSGAGTGPRGSGASTGKKHVNELVPKAKTDSMEEPGCSRHPAGCLAGTRPKGHVNMSAGLSLPIPGRRAAASLPRWGCAGGRQPPTGPWHPLTQPSVPSTLSLLPQGGSQEALASRGAWRTAAQALCCKPVRLCCSRTLRQCGCKAVRGVLSRSPGAPRGQPSRGTALGR